MDSKQPSSLLPNPPTCEISLVCAATAAHAELLYPEPNILFMVQRRDRHRLLLFVRLLGEWRSVSRGDDLLIHNWLKTQPFDECWDAHTTYVTIDYKYAPPTHLWRSRNDFWQHIKTQAGLYR